MRERDEANMFLVVFIIIVLLKLFGAAAWSWWWVLSPIWGFVSIVVVASVFRCVLFTITDSLS